MNSSMRTRLFICSAVFSSALLGCSQERHFSQPNSGMEPTVLEGEKFVVDTTAYRRGAVSRGDVVVFKHDGLLILKRVIAISDDAVEGRDFQVILNGKPLKEDYVQHTGKNSISEQTSFLRSFSQVKVPGGRIFVMGDNRDYSDDSRDPTFGSIPAEEIIGKAVRIVKSDRPQREGSAIR
jgi:signal peptidase I